MSDIDPAIGKVLKECGLGNDAVWKHKQSGSWIAKHWALEKAAAHKNIIFDAPQIIFADPEKKLATICATGHLGDRTEWSIGEAAPYNTQQQYPFAMAEKRAKDRVILKLIGLHGLAYSEEEADDFKENRPKEKPLPSGALGKTAAKAEMQKLSVLIHDNEQTPTVDMLNAHLADHKELLEQVSRDWPEWIHGMENNKDFVGFNERIHDRREELAIRDAENLHPQETE